MLLTACTGYDGGVPGSTGLVSGHVLSSPSCPVERVGEECPPRPVAGAAVEALQEELVRGSTRTDREGAFRLTLPVGRYIIKATNVGGYGSTASEEVVVSADPVQITLIVDSGIR